ncbi:enhancer of mRNA-decapping protein 4-like, partial [Diaphorina citri]|uniref:Enhancer of mRNA-decapping protein 4-like n=1 Tax=Diaphorina citri TaxID=121845 RepID=A0A3Q0JI80_DIACI
SCTILSVLIIPSFYCFDYPILLHAFFSPIYPHIILSHLSPPFQYEPKWNHSLHPKYRRSAKAHEQSPSGPYKLVWYGGDKESNIPRALAVTRGRKIEIWNVDGIYESNESLASTTALPLSSVREHILDMNQHTDLVTRVCFSVDGAAVATASLDGRIMFFQIVDLDEPNVPKPLHSWRPHKGAPVTHMLLLDNYEEDVFWRFLVSFSDNNSVMKIWSCESWQCLQTFSFHGSTPGDTIHMIPYVDRYSKYIYLSDCYNKVFYVLELYNDTSRPVAYVFKFAAFLVISPILSVHVNSCEVVPKRCNMSSSGLMLGTEDEDAERERESKERNVGDGTAQTNC